MTTVTLNLTTVFIGVTSVTVGLLAWLHRQATEQTRIAERVNWLCERYAKDHDASVPWAEPITDGGQSPNDSLFERLSSANESETEYNGFLSYAGEFHALAVGLSVGFGAGVAARPELAAGVVGIAFGLPALANGVKLKGRFAAKELRREPWYGAGSALIGYAVGAIIAGNSLPF